MRAGLIVVGFSILAACNFLACSDPPPKTAATLDQVPANSLSDDKLHADAGSAASDDPKDPTQPLITKVGEKPMDLPAAGGDTDTPPSASSGKPAKPGPPGSTVSKAECDKVMDKYISLEIASNPQLKGVGQDVIDQAKQMMREKNGEAPCTTTKAQYKCAMATSTKEAWQKCMK